MIYLITQVLALLAAASLLSLAIGWLLRRFKAARVEAMLRQRLRRSEQAIPPIKDALAQAHDDLDRQDADIAALRRELGERADSIEDAEQRQRELEAQLKRNKDAAARAEADKLRLQQDVDALRITENEAQDLHSDLQDRQAELSRLAEERADLERQLAGLKASLAEKDKQLQSAAGTNANLEGIIANLNKDLAHKSEQANAANEEQKATAADVASLQARIDELNAQSAAKVAELEKQLGASASENGDAQSAITAGEHKIAALQQQLADRTSERDKLARLVADQKKEITTLQREIVNMQKALADASNQSASKVRDLEHALDKERALAAQNERQMENDAVARTRMQQDLDRAMADIKNALTSNDNKAAEMGDALEQQKLAAVQANTARAENERKYGDLKREFDALKKASASAQQKLLASETEAAGLREKGHSAAQRIADLEQSIAGQQNANEQARRELEREISGLQSELKDRASELQNSAAAGADLQIQLNDYQSLEAELRARIAKLESMLSEERRLAGQSLLSRIVELESMLEAERRKAEDLPEIPEVSEVKVRAQIQRTSSANSQTLAKKRA